VGPPFDPATGQGRLPERFEVLRQGELVMEVTHQAGYVVQGGAPPPTPGEPPPNLRGFTIYAHELVPGPGVLEAIDASRSTTELLDRLEALGYHIRRKW
jgi:hypothetical protein